MGPLLWWWRWWLGDDPNSDRQLVEARTLLDEQRAQADELATQLQARDSQIEQLRGHTSTLERTQTEADEAHGQLTAELEQARAELTGARTEVEQLRARVNELETAANGQAEATAAAPDLSAAKQILGTRIKADDLTVVDGVGPKIAGLLTDAGIDSWRALGDADVERLRAVLSDAGPRYQMHDPSPWPTQARLLATGRWQDFKDRSDG